MLFISAPSLLSLSLSPLLLFVIAVVLFLSSLSKKICPSRPSRKLRHWPL
jgi:hypothetical protein